MNEYLRNALFGFLGGMAGAMAARTYWRLVRKFRGDMHAKRRERSDEPPNIVVAIHEDGTVSYINYDDPEVQMYERITGRLPGPETVERLEIALDLGTAGAKGALLGVLSGERGGYGMGAGATFATIFWMVRGDLWKKLFSDDTEEGGLEVEIHRLTARISNALVRRAVTQSLHRLTR